MSLLHRVFTTTAAAAIILASCSSPLSGTAHALPVAANLFKEETDSTAHSVMRRGSSAQIAFAGAPLGKANSYILNNLGWRIEEEAADQASHFEIVRDDSINQNVLRVTLHSIDGNGHAKSSDNSVARQEIKSSLKGAWSRKLPSSPELWRYELTIKMDPKYQHTGDRFYHLWQLKFEKATDGTPLLTVGTRADNFGMYVAMSTGNDQQKFVKFGPLGQYRGKWLRVEILINAQKGPNATIHSRVYDARTNQLLHSSQTIKGRMDWNSSTVFRPKLGQYKSLANGRQTNVVYYQKLSMS